ncbi:MAG: RNA polymerase sigma factor [Bacteroidales bacterium]|nr:RNA polymerase sigma factor [Bacteroidales bacterium]MDD2425557.1 RNA polymerase sigma factor [Bacteroidales bacterium]MDD3990031.1 RNA polymerase sigma factor [Bacteroidales bacterium]
MDETQKDWVKFLKDGNEKSFFNIYESSVHSLYSYGIAQGFSHDQCLDAIQDIFLKLYINKSKLHHINNLRFYLLRSFKNRLFDIIRKNRKSEPLTDKNLPFAVEVSVSELLEHKEEQSFLKRKVEKILSLLTDRQREAVYLRYMQDLDYEEIATMMDMQSESVRKLVFRALESVRKETRDNFLKFFILILHLF